MDFYSGPKRWTALREWESAKLKGFSVSLHEMSIMITKLLQGGQLKILLLGAIL